MLMRLLDWLGEREARRNSARRLAAYDGAAGALLRGADPNEVRADIDILEEVGDRIEANGMRAALYDHSRLQSELERLRRMRDVFYTRRVHDEADD